MCVRAAQVLARRVRKVGEALRRAVPGEVDALAAGATSLPQDLASWECLSAGGLSLCLCGRAVCAASSLCQGTCALVEPEHISLASQSQMEDVAPGAPSSSRHNPASPLPDQARVHPA